MRLFKTKYNKESDEHLMKLVRKGDQLAFDEIYSRYAAKLAFYFTRKLKHDREKGEDFVHDLFAKLIDRPQLFDTQRTFKTWIYSVANNMCINEYKKMAVRSNTTNGVAHDLPIADQNKSIDEQVTEKDFKSDLEQVLERLDDKHREVFVMRHIDGLSVKEVGAIIDVSPGTVKSRLFYATKKVAQALAQYNPKETTDHE